MLTSLPEGGLVYSSHPFILCLQAGAVTAYSSRYLLEVLRCVLRRCVACVRLCALRAICRVRPPCLQSLRGCGWVFLDGMKLVFTSHMSLSGATRFCQIPQAVKNNRVGFSRDPPPPSCYTPNRFFLFHRVDFSPQKRSRIIILTKPWGPPAPPPGLYTPRLCCSLWISWISIPIFFTLPCVCARTPKRDV